MISFFFIFLIYRNCKINKIQYIIFFLFKNPVSKSGTNDKAGDINLIYCLTNQKNIKECLR